MTEISEFFENCSFGLTIIVSYGGGNIEVTIIAKESPENKLEKVYLEGPFLLQKKEDGWFLFFDYNPGPENVGKKVISVCFKE